MTPTEALAVLRQHNKWRSGTATAAEMLSTPRHDAKTICRAIDTACDSLEESLQFVATMSRDLARIKTAIKLGGFDLAECGVCGRVIVAIPDGLYMCGECAAKEG